MMLLAHRDFPTADETREIDRHGYYAHSYALLVMRGREVLKHAEENGETHRLAGLRSYLKRTIAEGVERGVLRVEDGEIYLVERQEAARA